jgi:hypothetical protein
MKLKAITLTEHETEGVIPETITVEMTARELVFLAKTLGKQNGNVAETLLPGGTAESAEIYDCLTGDVANRFFDSGVEDWARVVAK